MISIRIRRRVYLSVYVPNVFLTADYDSPLVGVQRMSRRRYLSRVTILP